MAPVALLGNVCIRGGRGLLLLVSLGLGWATHSALANDVVPPEEPKALTVQDVGNNLVLSWQPVATDVTGVADSVPKYRVYSTSSADFVPAVANRIGEPTTSGFSHAGAFSSPNDYYYLVSAVDDGNIEGNRRSTKVKPAPIVSLSHQGGNGALTWAPALPQAEVAGYHVFWGTSSLAYQSSFDVGSGITTANFGPLSPGSTYYATVLAIDPQGNLSPFIGEASIDLSGGGAGGPGITASVSPQANENGWNNTDVTVTFSCSGTSGTIKPNSHATAQGAQQGFSNPANAWDSDLGTKASCNYNTGFCGGNFGFPPVGTLSGHVDVRISAASNCLGAPKAEAYYSLNGGQSWTQFVSHVFASAQPVTFSSPQLNGVNSTSFLVQVRGVAVANCSSGTASVHDIAFVGDGVGCPGPVTVTGEGAGQIASGTAMGTGGSTTVRVTLNIDKTPPAIESTVTPTPNAADWNKTNAVVTFDCTDGLSGVESCNGPETVTTEGQNQSVPAQATDLAGNTGMTTAFVSIDKTAPELTLDQPSEGMLFGSLTVPVSGTVADAHLAGVTCNGSSAEISGVGYSCSLPLPDDSEPTITVQATDLADNTSTEVVNVVVDRVGVTILSPPANALYGLNDFPSAKLSVSGTVDDPAAVVTVNGIEAQVNSGNFTVREVPLKDGNNLLTATAKKPQSGAAGTASVQVTFDSQPPVVLIDSPSNGHVTTATGIIVAGMLNDIVIGTVNGGIDETKVEVQNLSSGGGVTHAEVKNRSFVTVPVALIVGQNVIQATGYDAVGNTAETTITVNRVAQSSGPVLLLVGSGFRSGSVGTELSAPADRLRVALMNGSNPVPGKTVIFQVTENNGTLRCLAQGNGGGLSECALAGVQTTGRSVAVTTDSGGEATAYWTLGMRSGSGNNVVEATAVGYEGSVSFVGSAASAPPAQISIDTGILQAGAVGEPLPRPFVAVVTDAGHNRLQGVPVTFEVKVGGGKINGQPVSVTVMTDSDGRAVATLTLGPEEGFDNNVVDATFQIEGNPSPPATFAASGRASMDSDNTRISGVVVDNTDTPLAGVTMLIHVNATDTIETVTDDQGQFTLFGVPVGNVMLVADPRTIEDGQDWPELHYEMVTVAGRDNTVGMPIYLLPLNPDGTDKAYITPTQGGTVTLQKIPGFSLEILANSVTFPDGSKTGEVSVTVVHADKIPMVPTFGAQPRLAITIQPPGAKFDPPAKVTFPNVHGLAPGEITELVSFDHDIGQFVSIGTGTVSEDGRVILSDPGVGILEGGWHGDCGCAPPTGRPMGPPLTCEQESGGCEVVETQDIVVIAWVDKAPFDLIALGMAANQDLKDALNSTLGCPTTLIAWRFGNRDYIETDGDRRYANAWLLYHSANQAPPQEIDPSAEFESGDYRLFNRLKARLTLKGGNVLFEALPGSDTEVGATPEPCTGIRFPVQPHVHDGTSGVRSSGNTYQLSEARLDENGQRIDLTLNDCEPDPILPSVCENIDNYAQVTAWIWSVVSFDPQGNLLPLDHQIFPRYFIYRDNVLVQPTGPQGDAETFIELDTNSQRKVTDIP